MQGPRILLIVGGGIAAYKACELIRLIRRSGGEVQCVLTEGGAKFITAMTLAALSENPVHTTLWDLRNEVEMGHIQLSRDADLVVVCPATADLLAKMANGIADDLATTLLLATDKPVMVVPAMNVKMWEHAATQRNVLTLADAGVAVLPPDEGPMACGEFGPGRLPEPSMIWNAICQCLALDHMFLPAHAEPEFDLALEPEEDFVPAGDNLGGLSAGLIARSGKGKALALEDQALEPDVLYAEALAEPLPEVLPLVEIDPAAAPILSKKGKARAAPPTDPEAINHTVSARDDAAAPEPIEGDEGFIATGRAVKGAKVAAVSAPGIADPLEGQPDFAGDEQPEGPLSGRHVLITAGPTHEAIDPVRYIANRSSGKQGFAIAAAAAAAGAQVTLVSGPVHLPTPRWVQRVDVESAREMAEAVKAAMPADVAVMVAAVADWRPSEYVAEKIKKRGAAPPAIRLTENPDILSTVAASTNRPKLLIGFAAETENVVPQAKDKRTRKGADWIIANDVSGNVMGGDANRVHIVTEKKVEHLDEMPKDDVARAIVERIANAINKK
jgi:phosphopantothenoylcysteine decarboxylase/phosphopantothenate--cysteine ligase